MRFVVCFTLLCGAGLACQTTDLGGVPVSLDGEVCDPVSGAGLKSANVTLTGAVTRNTLSSATGHYVFDAIPPGKYTVHAVAGAVTREFAVDLVDLARSATDGHVTKDDPACRPQPVVPTTGELDGQICNRHTESFVTDATVTITVGDNIITTTTDTDGTFRLKDVPAGAQVVVVHGSGYQRSFAVTITAGETTTLDDKLAQNCNGTSATEGGMVGAFCDPSQPPAADGTAAPLVGASVTVALIDPTTGQPVSTETFFDVTDENGQFEINGLEPGNYQVDVGQTVTVAPVLVTAGSETTVNDPHSQCTPPPKVGQIDGQLCNPDTGGLFHGQVDLISGVNLVGTKTADASGQFEFDHVAPGTYDVKAHDDASGYTRDYTGVVVTAYQTAHIDEGGVNGASCPGKAPVCQDFTNQPQSTQDGRILWIVDRSGSMTQLNADGVQKWDAMRSVVEGATSSLQSTVEFGLMFFPLPGSTSDPSINPCPAGDQLQVQMNTGDASQIQSVLDGSTPVGGTPTAATLGNAYNFVQALAGNASDHRPLAVVLATDGAPNCNASFNDSQSEATCRCTQPNDLLPPPQGLGHCGGLNCLDDINTYNQVGRIKDLGVDVFVIGELQGGDTSFSDVLDQMAVVGGTALPGTTKYYQATTQTQLDAAISSITTRIAACHVEDDAVDFTAQGSVSVTVGGQAIAQDIAHQNGWDITGAHSIDLFGSACDLASSTSINSVVSVHMCN